MGCVTQIGEQGWNVGRMAVLAAGWPVDVSATTVDRQCGSSMQTNFNAAAAVMAGQLDLVVSAGVEMMSRVPMGSNGGSISEQVTDRLRDRHAGHLRGAARRRVEPVARGARRLLARVAPPRARRLGRRQVRARDRADRAAALRTRARTSSCGVHTKWGGWGTVVVAARSVFAVDEAPRRETSADALAALQPAFDPAGVDHRRQLVADRRRRGCGADRERAGGAAPRPRVRARGSSRSASPASTRRGCCTATRRRWRRRLRRRG